MAHCLMAILLLLWPKCKGKKWVCCVSLGWQRKPLPTKTADKGKKTVKQQTGSMPFPLSDLCTEFCSH